MKENSYVKILKNWKNKLRLDYPRSTAGKVCNVCVHSRQVVTRTADAPADEANEVPAPVVHEGEWIAGVPLRRANERKREIHQVTRGKKAG